MPSSNLSDLLRPGTLFSGTATEPGRADSRFVLIEITDPPAGAQKVSAVLRNDGGWSDARAFQGDWIVGPHGAGKWTLWTRNSDRIPGAGPMLDDRGASSLVLQFRADGSAIVSPGNWTIRRLDPAAAAAIKTDLNRAVTTALAATKSGVIYRGTVASRRTASAEPIVLRFVDQNSDGSLLLAALEPAGTAGGPRTFHGTILGNSYRAGSTPIPRAKTVAETGHRRPEKASHSRLKTANRRRHKSWYGRPRLLRKTGSRGQAENVGSLPPPPTDAVKKYPQLGTYPLLELALETFLANGNRYALLYLIGPGLIGFGPKRVEATLETPKPDVTLLRCTAELAPGRYAFSCGAQSFEVGVK